MLRVSDSGRARRLRNISVVLVLVALVATGLATVFVGGPTAAAAAPPRAPLGPTHVAAATPTSPSGSAAPPARGSGALPSSPLISGPNATVPFWGNNSTFASSHVTQGGACSHSGFSSGNYNYSFNYCYSGFTDPNLLKLSNGHLGVAYDYATQGNPPGCLSQPGNLSYVVAFDASSNGGVNFGTPLNISGGGGCSYFNGIEPTFTTSSSGLIYGAWVEENSTTPQYEYSSRAGDGLAFTSSTNNGASFTAPLTINSNGNIARPQIVAYGDTVYVLYENISNTTTTSLSYAYGSCCGNPIALNVVYSSNGGVSWNGPYTLPGANSTDGYTSFGGWLQVNKTGTLGVSYFTNQTCVNYQSGYCYDYGANLVFSTSVNNGTTWAAPFTIKTGLGESNGYMDAIYLPGYFQSTPTSQFVFSANGQTVYAVWMGTYTKNSPYPYSNYYSMGIYAGTGSPFTVTGWTTTTIQASLDQSNSDDVWNPSIAWVGSTLYVTFTWSNLTYCYGSSCSPVEYTFSQWEASSTDGITWTAPAVVDYDHKTASCSYYYCFDNYFGLKTAALGLNSTYPVFGFTLGEPESNTYSSVYTGQGYNFYYNYSYSNRLEVAFPYTGKTVSVNFTEQNLPVGTNWSFMLNGYRLATTSPSMTVTDIPYNVTVTVIADNVPASYNTIIAPGTGVSEEQTFTTNATIVFNYSVQYGLVAFYQPFNHVEYGEIQAYIGGSYTGDYYYFYNETFLCTGCVGTYTTPAFPWYFAAGTVVTLETYSDGVYPSFWNGTGLGNYTGGGSWANVTMGTPVNETAWWAGLSYYNVQVNPIGLPSTSTYSFTFDGTNYSAAGTTSVTISSVETGAHTIGQISATSSTAGWGYIGSSTPASPVIIPLNPEINLTFAYIDLSAPLGTVSFEAQGLTAGTVWHFAFNGTTYSSDTPWINVSTRPGTFPVQAFPVTSQNSTVGFAPTGVSATMSVTTGSTYTIDFAQSFEVSVGASTGGTVSAAGAHWLVSGASASYVATAGTNYVFGGWSGTGAGSYTGSNATASVTANGPIVESAVFYPVPGSRFNLTFVAVGLDNSTWWSVFVGGIGYSTNHSTLVVHNLLACNAPGSQYPLSIPYAYSANQLTRYIPTSHLSSTICTTGSTVVTENFAAQYLLTLQQTAGGYASATIGFATYTTSVWVSSGATVTLGATPQTGYVFLGWNGTGLGSFTGPGPVSQETIVMAGPVTELASFALPTPPVIPVFWVDFHLATALASGTSWSVALNGTGYSSTGSDIIVNGLHAGGPLTVSVGNALSPDGLTEYTPIGVQPSITVTHNTTLTVSFSLSFWVQIETTVGGTVHPASGWFAQSGSVLLSATPASGYSFVGWAGTGANSYNGPIANQSVKVTAPITEVATFAPLLTPGTQTTTGTSSIWSSPIAWIGLAIVGLLIGLVLGMLLARRRRSPPGPPEESGESTTSAPDAGTTEANQ